MNPITQDDAKQELTKSIKEFNDKVLDLVLDLGKMIYPTHDSFVDEVKIKMVKERFDQLNSVRSWLKNTWDLNAGVMNDLTLLNEIIVHGVDERKDL